MLEDQLTRSFYLLFSRPSLIDLGQRVKFLSDRLAVVAPITACCRC